MSQETPTLDQQIYKIKQLVNGNVNTIYIFNGKIASENEDELFERIFTAEEIEQRELDAIASATEQAEREAAAEALAVLKASARAKLISGDPLTSEEAAVLIV